METTDVFQLNFSGLDPTKRYTVVLTANRNQAGTRVLDLDLLDSDSSTEASGGTTTVLSPTHVQLNADDNTSAGNVARWTNIAPGSDGDFSVRANRVTAIGASSFAPAAVMLQETTAGGNAAPVAVADAYYTAKNAAKVVAAPGVLANDTDAETDPLTAVLVDDVNHGSLSLASDGGFTYTPTAGYDGPDSFTYKANDGTADSNIVTVSLNVGNTGLQLGTSSYVTFGDPAKLDLAQFTIETWFKKTGTGTPNTTGGGGITILPLVTHGSPEQENSDVDANWILGHQHDRKCDRGRFRGEPGRPELSGQRLDHDYRQRLAPRCRHL